MYKELDKAMSETRKGNGYPRTRSSSLSLPLSAKPMELKSLPSPWPLSAKRMQWKSRPLSSPFASSEGAMGYIEREDDKGEGQRLVWL